MQRNSQRGSKNFGGEYQRKIKRANFMSAYFYLLMIFIGCGVFLLKRSDFYVTALLGLLIIGGFLAFKSRKRIMRLSGKNDPHREIVGQLVAQLIRTDNKELCYKQANECLAKIDKRRSSQDQNPERIKQLKQKEKGLDPLIMLIGRLREDEEFDWAEAVSAHRKKLLTEAGEADSDVN
jgi:hypothetical protein